MSHGPSFRAVFIQLTLSTMWMFAFTPMRPRSIGRIAPVDGTSGAQPPAQEGWPIQGWPVTMIGSTGAPWTAGSSRARSRPTVLGRTAC